MAIDCLATTNVLPLVNIIVQARIASYGACTFECFHSILSKKVLKKVNIIVMLLTSIVFSC